MLRLLVVTLIAACVPPPTVTVTALPSLLAMAAEPVPAAGELVRGPPRLEESVELWFESRPERPTREVALIEVRGDTIEAVLQALRRQGAYSSCDGLIVHPPEVTHFFITVAAICVAYVKA